MEQTSGWDAKDAVSELSAEVSDYLYWLRVDPDALARTLREMASRKGSGPR